MIICSFCGEDHSWLYCRKKPEGWKPPKKSTTARKDVPRPSSLLAAPATLDAGRSREAKDSPQSAAAGTQAPPVDTPKPKYKDRHKPGYQAQKQREYRARKREGK